MNTNFVKIINRIDHLISIKKTGSASEMAKKIGISRANAYQYIKLMKEFGAPIKYDQQRKTYFYDVEGSFVIYFFKKL